MDSRPSGTADELDAVCDRQAERIASLETQLAARDAAIGAVIAAWEHDEIGQVDGELITALAKALEVKP
jgi:hypothetical protein